MDIGSLVQTVAPTEEPVSLATAKAHMRVEINDDDALITTYIGCAREHAEAYLHRQLVTATWRLDLDDFPDWELILPNGNLQSVTSITYLDTAGVSQTLAATEYLVDASSVPGRLTPAFSKNWPAVRGQINAVSVTYVAGYGAASAVPAAIRTAVLQICAHLYEQREATATVDVRLIPLTAERLLRPYRMITLRAA